MPLYFLIHDADRFHRLYRPPLAAAWRQRTFEPCRQLCHTLLPTTEEFAARFHVGETEPLLARVARGLPFDRAMWRHLVGEVLLYGAVEIPELLTALDTLCCLLASENYAAGTVPRERFTPIEQAHLGTRDLVFGGGYYRPEQAGWNDVEDVRRLARYLDEVRTEGWSPEMLTAWREEADTEERAEEIAFARDCLATLRELYRRTAAAGQLVAVEVL